MLGLFFDVKPKPGHMAHYFAHVDRLKPVLARHTGLLYLERFRPLDDADALLSHQHWADDASLAAWRREARHRVSQDAGRRVHFEDYRIRVGAAVPADATADGAADTEPGRYVVTAAAARPLAGRAYESMTRPGLFLTLACATTRADAGRIAAAARAAGAGETHVFAVARDYTLTERDEAPTD
jgi:heme-degrading monooxygenase HmoA